MKIQQIKIKNKLCGMVLKLDPISETIFTVPIKKKSEASIGYAIVIPNYFPEDFIDVLKGYFVATYHTSADEINLPIFEAAVKTYEELLPEYIGEYQERLEEIRGTYFENVTYYAVSLDATTTEEMV